VVEVIKKESESLASLLRRFNRDVQQSGLLVEARKIRFYAPPKRKKKVRESAKRRTKIAKEKEYLRKIGKLPTFGRDANPRYNR